MTDPLDLAELERLPTTVSRAFGETPCVEIKRSDLNTLISSLRSSREREAGMVEALRPFADYADRRDMVPDRHVITQGSPLAKHQLTMGDCRQAFRALSAINEMKEADHGPV